MSGCPDFGFRVATQQAEMAMDPAADDIKVSEVEFNSLEELKVAFRRASSRLTEMASVQYNARHRAARGPPAV